MSATLTRAELKDRMTRMGQHSLYPKHIVHPMMPEDATPLMSKIVQNFCSWNAQWVSKTMKIDSLLNKVQRQYQSHRNGYNASPEQTEAIKNLVEAGVFSLDAQYQELTLINWV
jgi:hypothetical protein